MGAEARWLDVPFFANGGMPVTVARLGLATLIAAATFVVSWVLLAAGAIFEAIWWAFKEQRIVIAFPQLDVHIDRESLRALSWSRPQQEPPERGA